MSERTKASGTILVVDDEPAIRESLRMILEFEGYKVEEASRGAEALVRVADKAPDAVILDIKMPEMDGMAALTAMRERGYEMPVLMISGHGDVQTAVEATRRGAFDFFEKPLQRDRVLLSLRNAVESWRLRSENRVMRHEPDDLVGSSPAMARLRETIARAAPTTATVLITGESGTGKELVARAIHRQSQRRDKSYVQVNCAAIPEELIESELFGHEKGSFTGAVRKQAGKFVSAHGGTIFLDEVGDMSARTQAKVLRALQSGEIEPVGAQRSVRVDVRVVAATNRDLTAEIEAGRFREDLFYRLAVIPVRTPPLRERAEDVVELVRYFVQRYAEINNTRAKEIGRDALETLRGLTWKGNIRELKNLVERLLILSPGEVVTQADVLAAIGGPQTPIADSLLSLQTLREFQDESEKLFLLHQLEKFGWNVTQTAQAVDTPRSNLYKKMEQYGIKRDDAKG
jgi:two-component system nitrogen regulation response regulator NtrX